MTEELKGCPFCGGEAWLFTHSSAYTDEYSIRCEQGCCEVGDEDKSAAITAWNTRPPSPEETRLRELNARLVEGLRGDCDWLDALSQMTIERDMVLVRIQAHRTLIAEVEAGR